MFLSLSLLLLVKFSSELKQPFRNHLSAQVVYGDTIVYCTVRNVNAEMACTVHLTFKTIVEDI